MKRISCVPCGVCQENYSSDGTVNKSSKIHFFGRTKKIIHIFSSRIRDDLDFFLGDSCIKNNSSQFFQNQFLKLNNYVPLNFSWHFYRFSFRNLDVKMILKINQFVAIVTSFDRLFVSFVIDSLFEIQAPEYLEMWKNMYLLWNPCSKGKSVLFTHLFIRQRTASRQKEVWLTSPEFPQSPCRTPRKRSPSTVCVCVSVCLCVKKRGHARFSV